MKNNSDQSAAAKNPLSAIAKPYLNTVFNEDCIAGLARIADASVDLILTDPPYGLGKDYGNDSDRQEASDYLAWTERWIDAALPKLKPGGCLYIFLTWRYSPEIFVMLKQRMLMLNEIIWDRKVPSMGGSTRSFTSVHDTIGFFAKDKTYYFNLDAVRIPYDAATKKARSRRIFVGAKWLELGYNPKDLWSVSRLHKENPERVDHPTQKPLEIIERMIYASCPENGVILDPFMGSGTTAVAARRCGRNFVGFELNSAYCAIIEERLTSDEARPVARNNHPTEPVRKKASTIKKTSGAARGRPKSAARLAREATEAQLNTLQDGVAESEISQHPAENQATQLTVKVKNKNKKTTENPSSL